MVIFPNAPSLLSAGKRGTSLPRNLWVAASEQRRNWLRATAASTISLAPIRSLLQQLARVGLLPRRVQAHLPIRGCVPIRLLSGPEFYMESSPQNLMVRQLYFESQDRQEPGTLWPFAALVDRITFFIDVGA